MSAYLLRLSSFASLSSYQVPGIYLIIILLLFLLFFRVFLFNFSLLFSSSDMSYYAYVPGYVGCK